MPHGQGNPGKTLSTPAAFAARWPVGLSLSAELTEDETSRIAAIFAKAELGLTGKIRAIATPALSHADINYERHARACLGAVTASLTSDTAIFSPGGTEHQCLPGAAPIAAIVLDARYHCSGSGHDRSSADSGFAARIATPSDFKESLSSLA